MKKRLMLVLVLVALLAVSAPASASPHSDTTIWSVVKNESVTVRLEDFPSNDVYNVYMGFRGTLGLNGYLVSRVATNAGGTFFAKFMIPDGLENEEVISVRFESQNGAAPWWNYFYNTTNTSPVVVPESDQTSETNLIPGFPTFTLTQLARGSSITITTKYFQPGERWNVYVADGADEGMNGLLTVDGFESGEGGSIPVTFPIPSELRYVEKISVILYRIKDGFITYNLFKNQDYP